MTRLSLLVGLTLSLTIGTVAAANKPATCSQFSVAQGMVTIIGLAENQGVHRMRADDMKALFDTYYNKCLRQNPDGVWRDDDGAVVSYDAATGYLTFANGVSGDFDSSAPDSIINRGNRVMPVTN
ncbi:hypothetical protein [Caballeronia sp. GAOx1]|uniref:hypothetical protein n=1 Tax=Caballeronia sp. GAOx1 TaxID=2921761 RepID=UPI002028345D|nr:hypothetical protein [Caballeronia sp. GAOx1]